MFVIRDLQMHALFEPLRAGLASRLSANLERYFSDQCRLLGTVSLERTVSFGIQRAARHGFVTEREVFLYLSLMFMLGSRFASDSQLPWAGEALARTGHDKVTALYSAAMAYLDRTVGPRNEEHLKVLLRVRRLDLATAVGLQDVDFGVSMKQLLHQLHSRKCDQLGMAGLDALLSAGTAAAARYDITCRTGRTVYIVHMFLLGSRFDDDPQFEWAKAGLTDASLPDGHLRAGRLHAAGLDYLRRALANDGA